MHHLESNVDMPPKEYIQNRFFLGRDKELAAMATMEMGDDDVEPTALPTTHVRRLPAKNYSFLIKWTGYEVPTWIAFKAARRLPHFNNYVSQFPSLKINEQS